MAELGLRIVIRYGLLERPHRYMTSDPVLHHRARANTITRVGGAEFSTNSLALRDREYSGPKPAGVFRMLMLGDSFTEGSGLPLEQTVARRVESALNLRGCGRYEVVNAGVASYSPILEYLQLQRLAPVLQPDLVVLNFDMTDVHDDVVRTATATLDARGLPVAVPGDAIIETSLLLPPLSGWLRPVSPWLNRLAIFQAFRKSLAGVWLFGPYRVSPELIEAHRLYGDLVHDPVAITRDPDYPELARGWALTERYLLGIRDQARARRIPFVLVVYPHGQQVSPLESIGGRRQLGASHGLYASERPFKRLEELGKREGFPVVNLLALFRAEHAKGLLFRGHDIHHTSFGASVFADGVLSGLLAVRALPACSR